MLISSTLREGREKTVNRKCSFVHDERVKMKIGKIKSYHNKMNA